MSFSVSPKRLEHVVFVAHSLSELSHPGEKTILVLEKGIKKILDAS